MCLRSPEISRATSANREDRAARSRGGSLLLFQNVRATIEFVSIGDYSGGDDSVSDDPRRETVALRLCA